MNLQQQEQLEQQQLHQQFPAVRLLCLSTTATIREVILVSTIIAVLSYCQYCQ
jgi:hypothetical protein